MSLILGLALAAALTSKPDCSWDRPGLHPFMGDVVQAVDRYKDIAPEVRNRLKQRMQKREYDDIASIRRDSIEGKFSYEPSLRGMHFGNGSVCAQVSRTKWTAAAQERGLVYCEKNQCIIVPTVCRNVSRITRRAGPDNSAATAAVLPAVVVIDVPVPPLPPEQAGTYLPVSSVTNTEPDFSGGRAFQSFQGAGSTFAGIGAARIAPDLLGGAATPNPVADPAPPTSPVPEPGTWAMLLAGLGLLAALRRRAGGRTARLGAPWRACLKEPLLVYN